MSGAGAGLSFRAMPREYPTALELVGHTPIVRLPALGRAVEPTLLAKLEYLNPGGSNKDRIGMAMIEANTTDIPDTYRLFQNDSRMSEIWKNVAKWERVKPPEPEANAV